MTQQAIAGGEGISQNRVSEGVGAHLAPSRLPLSKPVILSTLISRSKAVAPELRADQRPRGQPPRFSAVGPGIAPSSYTRSRFALLPLRLVSILVNGGNPRVRESGESRQIVKNCPLEFAQSMTCCVQDIVRLFRIGVSLDWARTVESTACD